MAYLKDPGTLLSNAKFGPGAFNDYYAAMGLGGLLGYVQNKTDPIIDPFGNPVSETPSTFDLRSSLSGKGLESFGPHKEGMMNEDNIKVLKKDEKTGGYLVMSKSGDKTGTVYAVLPTANGGYESAGVVQQNVPFDTNNPWWKQNIGIISVLAAPVLVAGAQALGVLGQGAMAAFPTGVGEVAGGIAGGAAGGAAMAPWDAALMAGGEPIAGSGFSMASGGTPAYGSPWTTGATLSQAGEAAGSIGGLPNLTGVPGAIEGGAASLGTQIPSGLEDILTMPEVTIEGTPPSPTDLPPYDYPLPTPDYGPIPEVPPIKDGLPNLPGGPSGGKGGPTQNDPNWLGFLASIADMWGKYQGGKDKEEFFNNWANRIFGKSADFENMLMGTYTNPASYYQGVEGQALGDMMENRLMRQDFKNRTNSTNRERLFQQGMLANLGNYRQGLTSSANIGRSQSGEVMRGAGEAFKGFEQSRNFATPAAWAAGQPGTPGLQDIWNTGKDIWNTGKDIWNWWNRG